ncbi:MAG: hypothetical protein Q8L48_05555 [Archangium sp.]|nr:hypothetical protein [Archangium sp.]
MHRPILALVFALQACAPAQPAEGESLDPFTLQLLRVTKETPSFGGFHSEAGALVVFIFDEAQRGPAAASLTAIFGDTAPALNTRPARGQSSESVKNGAADVLSVPGTSSFDFDETTGFLRVGVWKASALEPVQTKLLELSVPLESVVLEIQRPWRAL